MPDGGAGDDGRGDRVAGGDLGRVLDDAPGDPARLPAAHAGRLHLGARGRARSTCRASTGCCWSPWSCAVVGFGSSSALAAAYGIAVTVTMLITTMLTFFVVRYGWGFPLLVALARDRLLPRASTRCWSPSCSLKFLAGRLVPARRWALAMFAVMSTWKRGRELLLEQHPPRRPRADAVHRRRWPPTTSPRTPRTAVYTVAERRHRAAGAAAQPQAQPGAARAQRDPHGEVPRGARGSPFAGARAGRRRWRAASGA